MSCARSTSARMPQTMAVSPMRTTALPAQWEREPVFIWGVRKVEGLRPLGRVGVLAVVVGFRWARRKGPGEILAKVSRGKERTEGAVVSVIVSEADR